MSERIEGCVQPRNHSRSPLDYEHVIVEGRNDLLAGRSKKKGDFKIGIVGLGSVGTALKTVLSYYYKTVVGYDKKGKHNWNRILESDIVFVCVSTPGDKNGRLDCSNVNDVLKKLSDANYSGVVVIKSTLGLGFMDRARKMYPNLRLVYSPEFLRERSRLQWTINPDRLVFAGEEEDVEIAKSVYFWAEDAKIIITDYRSAELGKLLHNAFIALKVSFTNSVEMMAESFKANALDVMDIITSDRRVVSKEHLTPFKGPYGGKCVPKDTSEVTHYFGQEASLIREAERVNEYVKKLYRERAKVVRGERK